MSTDGSRSTGLVTGGSSGIGLGLAAAYHARGATVIIAGRSRDRLEAAARAHPGLLVEEVDVVDATTIAACAAQVERSHPTLDVLINNAGVQQVLDFARPEPQPAEAIAQEIDTNLKGVILVANAFLPLLKRQPSARLIHVSSGLAFVPLARVPVYCATKAAVHSFTVLLRRQLADTSVRVVELIPPAVETALHRDQGRAPPRAMPLDSFTKAAMAGLDAGRPEIAVGLAKRLRVGSRFSPGLFLRLINTAAERS